MNIFFIFKTTQLRAVVFIFNDERRFIENSDERRTVEISDELYIRFYINTSARNMRKENLKKHTTQELIVDINDDKRNSQPVVKEFLNSDIITTIDILFEVDLFHQITTENTHLHLHRIYINYKIINFLKKVNLLKIHNKDTQEYSRITLHSLKILKTTNAFDNTTRAIKTEAVSGHEEYDCFSDSETTNSKNQDETAYMDLNAPTAEANEAFFKIEEFKNDKEDENICIELNHLVVEKKEKFFSEMKFLIEGENKERMRIEYCFCISLIFIQESLLLLSQERIGRAQIFYNSYARRNLSYIEYQKIKEKKEKSKEISSCCCVVQ